ncbi:MAG: hypothetical protein M1814_004856 [Vezdaea aestivalis]|nr:MAG: hypothetical protein M1814_004856 [Vezdaea aestivalis]
MAQIQQRNAEQASLLSTERDHHSPLAGQIPAGQDRRQPVHPTRSTLPLDTRNPHRTPAGTSPLQIGTTVSSADDDNSTRPSSKGSVSDIQTHSFPKPPGNSKFSSRALFLGSTNSDETPRSPRERLDDLLASENSNIDPLAATKPQVLTKERRQFSDGQTLPKSNPPKQPVRNISSPTVSSRLNSRGEPDQMAGAPGDRNDSLDSSKSLSSLASHGRKSSQDSLLVEPSDVTSLISSAGSPEAAITRLLKEKHSASTQNSQLWRLVEKQRAMILGLNIDMDRVLKDKEKYKKKLKDHLAQVPPALEFHKKGNEKHDEKQNQDPEDSSSIRDMVSNGLRDSATLPAEEPLRQRPVEAQQTKRKSLPSEPSFDGFDDKEGGVKPKAQRNLSEINTSGPTSNSIPSPLGSASSPRGFAASRALPHPHRRNAPSIGVDTEVSKGMTTDRSDIITPTRKPPPAPLVLPSPNGTTSAPPSHLGPDDHSGSEYEDNVVIKTATLQDRGRRKTREADDQAREVVAAHEEEHRSRSKKEQKSKSTAPPEEKLPANATATKNTKTAPPRRAVPVAPPSNLAQLVQGDSMAAVLNQAPLKTHTNNQRFVTAPQPSPGLPTSPRPADRPLNSPAPRNIRQGANLLQSPPLSSTAPGFSGLPLSPRAPRQPFPLPPNTPMSMVSPGLQRPGAAFQISSPLAGQFQRTAPDVTNILATQYRSIYRGLVSEQYPSLLLPPNALPLIAIKVSSSRMKPSRASFIAGKPRVPEDENVFTLGVFARSDGQELWRVEKEATALPQLDHRLKQSTKVTARIPDRSLFTGHAPSKIDARRAAIDQYFEAVLDTEIDNKTALELCSFLSTDAIEPAAEVIPTTLGVRPSETSVVSAPAPKKQKEGYLTKRGKNFGGWKARYFVLEGPVFRYFEAPGGAHLGTIKLQNSRIGKQNAPKTVEGASSKTEDDEDEYRHAFMVLEPRKKDSSSHLQHVLCAESDAERDEWVEILLQFVDYETSDDDEKAEAKDGGKSSGFHSMKMFVTGRKDVREGDSPSASSYQEAESLKGFSYENAPQAETPANLVKSSKTDESPSPPLISGPTNGARIQDAEAWGNKSHSQTDKKEHKKRHIFGFRGRSSSDLQLGSTASTLPTERNVASRPCFGIPLSEAAEYCRPEGVEAYLPAVVYRCIEYLEAKDAALEEGIFRLSGSNTVIKSLRERFNNEGDVNILAEDKYFDVHAVASLLKLYLRELPASILTRELHLDFLRVLDLENKKQKVIALNHLAHSLPKPNWWILRALSAYLLTIITASDTNKMTVRNVGIVFSPTLNIPAPVFSLFVTDFDDIFCKDLDDTAASPIAPSPTTPLTPEDIRSPRKQMFSELSTPSFNQTSFPGLPTSPRHAPTLNAPEPRSPNATGFMPMPRQTQFANPYAVQYQSKPAPMTQVTTGQEFGSLNGALAPVVAPPQESASRSNKAKRRESSMLGMGMGYGSGTMQTGGGRQNTINEDI